MKSLVKYFINYEEEKGLAFRFRQKRSLLFKKFIADNFDKDTPIRIIDLGGTEVFWQSIGLDFMRENKITVDILNVDYVPVQNTEFFRSFAGDACTFQSEELYDVCFSNSVIEHVGGIERIISFSETSRKIARTYFIQTPNFYFPIEPHFLFPGFHWLPAWVRVKLISWFSIGHFPKAKDHLEAIRIIESCNLLTPRVFSSLYFDAEIKREIVLGMSKSLIAIRNNKAQPAT
jgi:hypothetical protein